MKSNEELVEFLRKRGFSERILRAFERVDRKLFVPPEYERYAYYDTALPLSMGQTISQPSVIAEMLEMAELREGNKVLEIGTGSGYTAALIHEIVKSPVYTVEVIPELADYAKERLKGRDVRVFVRDGSEGLPEYAPYDRIIFHAALPDIPPIEDQLRERGIVVAPVGSKSCQTLCGFVKMGKNLVLSKRGSAVVFVPTKGKFGF